MNATSPAAQRPRLTALSSTLSPFEEVFSAAWPCLLPLFSTADARPLRATSRALRAAVAQFPWEDSLTGIVDLPAWRACFPKARAAAVLGHTIRVEHVACLRGVADVHLSGLDLFYLTNAAFANLSSAVSLNMGSAGLGSSLVNFSIALLTDQFLRLETLNISDNSVADTGAIALAGALRCGAVPKLARLDAGHNGIGSLGVHTLGLALKGVPLLASLSLEYNDIGDSGVIALAPLLASSPLLSSLNLSGNDRLSHTSITALAAAFPAIPRLRELHLSDCCGLGDVGMQTLSPALRWLPLLCRLDLANTLMGVAGVTALATGLGGVPLLTRLYVEDNDLGDDGVRALAKALEKLPLLRELDFSGTSSGAEGVCAVAVALRCLPLLTHLRLHNNVVSVTGAFELAAALRAGCTPLLKCLDVSDCCLEDAAAFPLFLSLAGVPLLTELRVGGGDDTNRLGLCVPILATAMRSLPRLRVLQLTDLFVGADGMRALSEALRFTPSLTSLRLTYCTIWESGAVHLAAALARVPLLRELSLSNCHLEITGAFILAASLWCVPRLSRLDVGGNSIGDAGLAALAAAVYKTPLLSELFLDHNQLTAAGARSLADAWAAGSFPRLAAVYLEANPIGYNGEQALLYAVDALGNSFADTVPRIQL